MISYEKSLQLIKQAVADFQLSSEVCAVEDLSGRVLARTIVSAANLPGFDNSAMDGFAMKANAGSGQICLPVMGNIGAGDVSHLKVGEGAVQIMTGAPVPADCETVIPVENVQIQAGSDGLPAHITLQGPVVADQNIRRAGQDVCKGDAVFAAGQFIGAEHIMMLAALGILQADVLAKPKISLISTGAELVDDASVSLQPGQIRNSNQPYLAAALQNWPVQSTQIKGHPDDRDGFLRLLERALDDGAQLVISTGAVSMGDRDFVPDALRAIGADIIFHKCKIRPGKPVLFAVLPGGGLFFGLPGNPVSAAVGFDFFVKPALRQILAQAEPAREMARLVSDFTKRAGFCLFAKAVISTKDNQNHIEVLKGQQSFRIAPLLQANCWAELPEDKAVLRAGDLVRFHRFYGGVL